MKGQVNTFIEKLTNQYQLALSAAEIPDGSGDSASMAMRIVVLIVVFPLTVLSHHATILMPGRWRYLEQNHRPVRTAKIAGFSMFVGSFIVLIAGAVFRAVHPWYSPDKIFRRSWINEPSLLSTLEDLHPLCSRSVADWNLLQLAGIPVLAEARNNSNYATFYREFAKILEIRLLEDNPDFGFRTTALIVFDAATKRLVIAPAAIPFEENYGIYFENELSNYYGDFIEECVPLYGIASTIFLSSLLPAPTEALTTGILGPDRVTVQWLYNATLSVKQELEVVYAIMDAFGLSGERPVFVGHGATGLIVKALQLQEGTEPWRVAFESAALADSPMATLSRASDNDDALPTIINFIGDGSLFAKSDDEALWNANIPVFPKAEELITHLREFIPPHALRTFCHIQAACGKDPRLDGMCEAAFPEDFKDGMCETYARPRTEREPESE
jgi:hypothetical protein